MGVATSWWACTHLCHSLKQYSRLDNFFDVEDCCMVVWLSLKIHLFGCVGWWASLFTIFLFTLLYLYLVCLGFTKETLPKFIRFFNVSCNLLFLVVTSKYVITWGVTANFMFQHLYLNTSSWIDVTYISWMTTKKPIGLRWFRWHKLWPDKIELYSTKTRSIEL